MEENFCRIAKLTADNYASWKEDIKAVLIYKGLYDVLEAALKKPVEIEAASAVSEPVKDEEVKSQPVEVIEDVSPDQKQKKGIIYSVIYLNVSEEYRRLIVDTKDGVVAWRIFEDLFEPSTLAREMSLLDQFFRSVKRPEETMLSFASRLKSISNQLSSLGESIPERYRAFQLLRFLPEQYQSLVLNIYRWPKEKFTFDIVYQELLLEENRLEQCKTDLKQVWACFSRTN